MIELYKIEGTENICTYDLEHPCYNSDKTWPNFQIDYQNFKKKIIELVDQKKSALFLRVADGEFKFLEGSPEGTNIYNRHLSNPISTINISKFWEGVNECDFISTQLYTEWTSKFQEVIKNRKIDFPMEFAYSIVANRWILKEFKGRIGIIGGEQKIKLIQELFGFQQYRDFLGIDCFEDYISVPERFSCNDVETLESQIGEKLKNSKSELFIFGIGISKLAVAHKFPNYHNAVYMDVGCGISALAGCTSLERPYFGGWTNFILENYNYSNIDRIDYRDTQGKNEIILKK